MESTYRQLLAILDGAEFDSKQTQPEDYITQTLVKILLAKKIELPGKDSDRSMGHLKNQFSNHIRLPRIVTTHAFIGLILGEKQFNPQINKTKTGLNSHCSSTFSTAPILDFKKNE